MLNEGSIGNARNMFVYLLNAWHAVPRRGFLLLFLLIITIVYNTHREYDTVPGNNETSWCATPAH